METLHRAKINVLRDKQNKAVEAFMAKMDQEIVASQAAHVKA
jgi:hypothetical protein